MCLNRLWPLSFRGTPVFLKKKLVLLFFLNLFGHMMKLKNLILLHADMVKLKKKEPGQTERKLLREKVCWDNVWPVHIPIRVKRRRVPDRARELRIKVRLVFAKLPAADGITYSEDMRKIKT